MDSMVKFSIVCVLLLSRGPVSLARWVDDDPDVWVKIRTRLLYPSNFVSVRINTHTERELRISHEKLLYMETYVPSGYTPDYDMLLKQLTDGRKLLQAVFQGGILKECDLSKESNQILDFISSFMKYDNASDNFGDVFSAATITDFTQKNTTLAHLTFENQSELKELAEHIDMKALRRSCQEFIEIATKTAEEEAKTGQFTNIFAQIIENSDPSKIIELEKAIPAAPISDNSYNRYTEEHNLSKRSTAPVKRARSKRGAMDFNSVLIFPGTKWCGKGDLAKCFDDLGDDQELDMCCRDHDCCPYVIYPFSARFNLFNYRFHSLLHCDCDQRFRGCLRKSQSSMANIIGKIYFNILGSKCFEFTESEVCVDRAWWGRCRKFENQTSAILRNQVSFIDDDDVVELDNSS